MEKKRGGQRKHWAEEARVLAWYHEIKRRCGWSDYKLDNEFAWTEEGKAFSSSADRPRTFECIRKVARKPAGQDKRWRSMIDLVAAIEQHPLFKGTRALYDAELWTLLQESTVTPQLLQSRINRLMRANGLVRVSFEMLSAKPGELLGKFSRASIFDRCLRLSLRSMDRLSQIELVWLVYQQSEPAQNWEFREKVEFIADKLLDSFFRNYFPEHHLVFYSDAIECLQHTRLDMTSVYGYLEVEGTRPVLPEQLAGKLEERHLFYF